MYELIIWACITVGTNQGCTRVQAPAEPYATLAACEIDKGHLNNGTGRNKGGTALKTRRNLVVTCERAA